MKKMFLLLASIAICMDTAFAEVDHPPIEIVAVDTLYYQEAACMIRIIDNDFADAEINKECINKDNGLIKSSCNVVKDQDSGLCVVTQRNNT